MWCLSPASVLWLLLLVHALLCSQLLPVVSGQTLYGCYPFTPANAQGQTISDGGVVGRNPRIVGILSWFSPSMDVMCNVSMLYADGAGYLTGPAHGYGDASCTSQQFAQGTQTYKMDWFYEGGYFVRQNSYNSMVVYTGFYMKSRCGAEYCGGAGGCPGQLAADPNSTYTPFAAIPAGSGYVYQQATNMTTQIRSAYYPQYSDRYMTCITSMSTCWNLTTVYDCSPPGPHTHPEALQDDYDDYDY